MGLGGFLNGCCKGDGNMWRRWEVSGIGVHDVKVPKISSKNYIMF